MYVSHVNLKWGTKYCQMNDLVANVRLTKLQLGINYV